MSYIIRYGEPVPDSVPVRALQRGSALILSAVLICAASLSFTICEEWKLKLFPWTAEPVQNAFAELCMELQEGEPFRDAFTEFCRDILNDAQKTA